ncbi:ABC transporter ATP-binding protein [Natronorubrum aibiense]|uniref:ABC-type D-xylose/L-arabinose transporter n=1 Tax=Natronorubrum aibiense TaxID=348826 RepID=A0A5P9P9H3_9EURY|nr:sn-glycerol-3-phosphate ABC transporter ATP-binding protein UgpC [Natronorubrum aibiense]QFU84776.1 sn-glycerol-3-phosphate ABC transporter ATP-binding protein UgpC [Natronorubrum aibiense]
MSTVTFSDVQKQYGDIIAIEDVSLEINDGEFVSILGPSGSGKSTLLRMIAGLEEISNGEISIGERVINGVAPQDRGIAMVFQNYALYPHMTVRDNMSYGLRLTTDLDESEIDERIESTAKMLEIEDHLEKRPANLSGGQQQRVATGRAIVRNPDVFLMDEPLSNLDAKLKMHMRTELQRIHDELETTTIYVTHDQEEAMTMSDRIVIVAEGQLQQVGPPEEIYNKPANRFVANFIGSPAMNFFDVTLEDDCLHGSTFEYPIAADTAAMARDAGTSSSFTLGVRPEHISLTDEQDPRAIRAELDVIEPIGSDNYLYATVGDHECTIRVPADVKPDRTAPLWLTFDESDIHLFDSTTNDNILTAPTPSARPLN